MRSVGGGVQRAALPKRVGEDFWRSFVAGGEGVRRGLWKAEEGYVRAGGEESGAADEDLLMKHSRVLAATGAFPSGQCGRNARRGRRRERGSVDGIANGVSPVGLSASGTGQLRWKAGGGRHWKRDNEGGVSEKRTTRKQIGRRQAGRKQMRRWQIVQE